jgi:hypothetical protein
VANRRADFGDLVRCDAGPCPGTANHNHAIHF